MILTTQVAADFNPSYPTDPGNKTSDRVFLLSIKEVEEYFVSNKDRQCEPTEYAKAKGSYVDSSNGNCWWWLRSPGPNSINAANVDTDGSVSYNGHGVLFHSGNVRPALWVNLES